MSSYQVTPRTVLALNPRHPYPDVAATKFMLSCNKFNIDSQRQLAMLVSQLAHESGLIPQEENLNYRASRIFQVWPNRFSSVLEAKPYEFNPRALGDKVYDNRLGDGVGEGFKYRGRGPIQLTGKDNLAFYGRMIGFDLIANPDLLLQYGVGFLSSAAFWVNRRLGIAADRGDVVAVTRGINGGFAGLTQRELLYQRALGYIPRFALLETDPPLDVERDQVNDLQLRQEAFDIALLHV